MCYWQQLFSLQVIPMQASATLHHALIFSFSVKVFFYDTQLKYLFPVVSEAWEAESNNQINKLISKDAVNLDGDGRCDSPGHCAKYGTYTLMDEDTGNVVAFNVVQVTEVSSSDAMEKEGFTRCIEMLEGKGVNISRVTTDRHVSISSRMAKDYPTLTINMMFGTYPSGWSKSSQTKSNKRVVRNWHHGYNQFPITCGGLLQPAMVTPSFYVKSGSQCWIMFPTNTSGQGILISVSAATGAFHPPKLRKSVGSSLAHQLT